MTQQAFDKIAAGLKDAQATVDRSADAQCTGCGGSGWIDKPGCRRPEFEVCSKCEGTGHVK